MKRFKVLIVSSLILMCLIIIGLIIENYTFAHTPANTPEFAIRKTLFSWGRPITALTAKIKNDNYIENTKHRFYVEGLRDSLGNELDYFYLEKVDGEWRVVGFGGP